MKKALAILGALLLVALGFLMPHIAAAYQDRSLEGDVRRMENAPVSLALAQELVDLPELSLLQSLDLFLVHDTVVELEEGRYTSEEEALQVAYEVWEILDLDAYFGFDTSQPTEAVPFLLSDKDGRSGVFWRCGWRYRPGEEVWIDDQHGCLAGFCIKPNNPALFVIGDVICQRFIPSYVTAEVLARNDALFAIRLTDGEETVVLPLGCPMADAANQGDADARNYASTNDLFVYFNIPSYTDVELGDVSDDELSVETAESLRAALVQAALEQVYIPSSEASAEASSEASGEASGEVSPEG